MRAGERYQQLVAIVEYDVGGKDSYQARIIIFNAS